MGEPLTVKDLLILVDGQNFISHVRKLFREEFDEEDYLPRNARWSWLFRSIKKMLGAETVTVYWYTIDDLDFYPHIDWEQENFDQFSDQHFEKWRGFLVRNHAAEMREKKKVITPAEWEFLEARGFKEKKKTINRWRRNCLDNQTEMERRLREWHELLDEISTQYPKVKIRRIGWQFCRLVTKKLGPEKGVDIGLATDLILKEDHYDTALLFSSDGDYVPAITAMQARGKRIGHVEYEFRTGEVLRGISRRLADVSDFALEIPWTELKTFLGMPNDPVVKKKERRREEEKKQRQTSDPEPEGDGDQGKS